MFAISTREVTVRQFREYAASRNSEDPPPALREPQEDEWPVGKVRFGDAVDYIVPGDCGPATGPSEIRDLATGAVIRPRTS